jgi:putative toxin-antitoxin system antitoxin component (TIGR02293 family)
MACIIKPCGPRGQGVLIMATTTKSKSAKKRQAKRDVSKRRKCRVSGLRSYDSVELVDSIHAGLEFGELLAFQDSSGLSLERIVQVVNISKRTLTRRRATGRLRPDESDRLLRLVRVFDLAVDLFEGDVDASRQWLEGSQSGLRGAIPLEFASTDVGACEVEKLIGRLEHGVFT